MRDGCWSIPRLFAYRMTARVDGTLPKSGLMPDPAAFLAAAAGKEALLAAPLARGDLRNSYAIGEEIVAGYGMADSSLPVAGVTVRGDIGVRYAHTRQTSSGHADNGTAAIPVSFERSYDNALPALNLVAEFTSGLQMHLAASKVITRPSPADLPPRLTINSNPTVLTAVGGNPGCAGELHAHRQRRILRARDRRRLPRCAGRRGEGQLQPHRVLRERPRRRACKLLLARRRAARRRWGRARLRHV